MYIPLLHAHFYIDLAEITAYTHEKKCALVHSSTISNREKQETIQTSIRIERTNK